MNINTNPNAFFTMQWCKQRGNREDKENIKVELIGAITGNLQYPIQNLRASTRGTVVKTTVKREYEIGQEVYFLDRWWMIENVVLDFSEGATQSAMFNASNVTYQLQIVGVEVKK